MNLLGQEFDLSAGYIPIQKLKQKLQEIDIFWFRLGYNINNNVLDKKTRCKYLVTPVTGIDHIDELLCKELGISIICLKGETEFLKEVRATAEHTILLTLMLMRKAFSAVNDVLSMNWQRDQFRGSELHRKKVGIIGYGRLGSIVADYFHTFGCIVGFYDIVKKEHPEYIKAYLSMENCIEECEIISLHVPYNENTHHLISQKVLKLFDSNMWLINTSRGGIVNEEALLNTFNKNNIAGAALDVLFGEPNIAGHALIEYAKSNNNLIITPHLGGCTYESFEKTESFIANKLLKTLSHLSAT